MSLALNNVTTSDAYTTSTTLICPHSERINIDVANAAVYYQTGHGAPPVWDTTEAFTTPAFRAFDRNVDAIRVRSGARGHPAQVSVVAVTGAEIPS